MNNDSYNAVGGLVFVGFVFGIFILGFWSALTIYKHDTFDCTNICDGKHSIYTNMSKKIGIDLVNNPDLACDPEISTKIACEYFKERGLLKLADEWNLEEITRKVNGSAKLHHDLRVQYSERALKTLSPI